MVDDERELFLVGLDALLEGKTEVLEQIGVDPFEALHAGAKSGRLSYSELMKQAERVFGLPAKGYRGILMRALILSRGRPVLNLWEPPMSTRVVGLAGPVLFQVRTGQRFSHVDTATTRYVVLPFTVSGENSCNKKFSVEIRYGLLGVKGADDSRPRALTPEEQSMVFLWDRGFYLFFQSRLICELERLIDEGRRRKVEG